MDKDSGGTMRNERRPLYSIGDRVEIRNYGALIRVMKGTSDEDVVRKLIGADGPYNLLKEDGAIMYIDILPELVGQKGVIDKVDIVQGIPMYAVSLDNPDKHAWYYEGQLKKEEKGNP